MPRPVSACLTVFLCLSLSVLFPHGPAYAEEKEKRISSEDLLKSRAGKLFREKKYEEAIPEFIELSKEYPNDPLVLRHLALSHEFTGTLDKAAEIFKTLIEKDPNDHQSRLSLANIYLRQEAPEKAIREFEKIVARDKDGPFGKMAAEKLETLKPKEPEKPAEELAPPEAKVLTAQEFVASPAAQLFRAGNYEEAIVEFEKMKEEYPNNILIFRYQGIAYHQLKRYDKAEGMFKAGLAFAPDNVATHFYLGETYIFQRKFKEAQAEYEYVVANDEEGRYAEAAQPRIELLKKPIPEVIAAPAAKPKPWSLTTAAGFEYDDNAAFNSSDPRHRSTASQNAGRYKFDVRSGYTLWKNPKNSLRAEYSYSQVLYDDSLNRLDTFSNTWGLVFTNLRNLWGKQLVIQLRDNLTHVILEEKFFVFVNSLSTTFIYNIHPRVQSVALYAFNRNQYDNDSAKPSVSGRDGFGQFVLFLNNIFLNKARTLRFTFGWDYAHDQTQGQNFIRDVHGARVGIHFPLFWRFEGDVLCRFTHDERPFFLATTHDGPRRDDVWLLTTTIDRRWGKMRKFSTSAFFTYNRGLGLHPAFEYSRPFAGFSVSKDF